MSNEYQHLGSDEVLPNERFQLFQDSDRSWWVDDTEGGEMFYIGPYEKTRDKARDWNYQWDQISLSEV